MYLFNQAKVEIILRPPHSWIESSWRLKWVGWDSGFDPFIPAQFNTQEGLKAFTTKFSPSRPILEVVVFQLPHLQLLGCPSTSCPVPSILSFPRCHSIKMKAILYVIDRCMHRELCSINSELKHCTYAFDMWHGAWSECKGHISGYCAKWITYGNIVSDWKHTDTLRILPLLESELLLQIR